MSILHSISCMCVCDWLTADYDICVYVYDIMDDTTAMWDNWPIDSWHTKLFFDSVFTRLILTLKQTPRMHKNALLPDKKKSKQIYGERHSPLPRPLPTGKGDTPPLTHSPWRLRRLDSRAFGARRSRSFSFTTRTLNWLKRSTCQTTADMNINESHDDDERYCLTSSRCSDKMADYNDTVVAAASTIIVAAAVRRRRRRKRTRWMRDWYLCSSMVTYIRLNDRTIIYRYICRMDTRLNMMNFWHLLHRQLSTLSPVSTHWR